MMMMTNSSLIRRSMWHRRRGHKQSRSRLHRLRHVSKSHIHVSIVLNIHISSPNPSHLVLHESSSTLSAFAGIWSPQKHSFPAVKPITAWLQCCEQYPDDWYMYVFACLSGVEEEKHPTYVPATRLTNESAGGAALAMFAMVAAARRESMLKVCAARAVEDRSVDGIVSGERQRSAPMQGGRKVSKGKGSRRNREALWKECQCRC